MMPFVNEGQMRQWIHKPVLTPYERLKAITGELRQLDKSPSNRKLIDFVNSLEKSMVSN